MKHILLTTIGLSLAAAPVAAKNVCQRGGDERVIEIAAPGDVGAACDLRYTRDGELSVPFHADNDVGYCAERKRALLASLIEAGFNCVEREASPVLREAGQERSFDIADIIADAPRGAGALPEAPPPAQSQPQTLTQPARAAALETPDAAAPAGDDARFAARGPVALAPIEAAVSDAPRQPVSGVGRFFGAAPEEIKPATQLAAANQVEEEAAPPAEPANATQAPQPIPASTSSATPLKLRPAPDLIRAVLAAQAAAWNDGDLDEFMAGYWKSPDLRFVSGGKVTTGWEPTLKRYRERYGAGGAALGRLAFENLDIKMITDDVAVVVGRYALDRDAGRDTGTFSLVMRRFEGLWRIVHDHTVADAPNAASN